MHITTILVATDFSESAQRACSAAAHMADRFGARVVLFHAVASPRLGRATPFFPMGMGGGGIAETLRAEARDRLRRVRESFFIGVEHVALVEQLAHKPARAIVAAAEHHDADLIVIGTHGLRGIKRALAGSVADRVVRRARRPVMVVTPEKPPEKPLETDRAPAAARVAPHAP